MVEGLCDAGCGRRRVFTDTVLDVGFCLPHKAHYDALSEWDHDEGPRGNPDVRQRHIGWLDEQVIPGATANSGKQEGSDDG